MSTSCDDEKAVSCPGPIEPVSICVRKGVGGQLIKIKYLQDVQIDFLTGAVWLATVTVYKSDNTVLFAITSPTRVTLAASGYNIQFQFTAADFGTAQTYEDGATYRYDVVMTKPLDATQAPIVALWGPLEYVIQPTADCCS